MPCRHVYMTTAMSLLNIMSYFHLVDDFAYLNQIQSNKNLFKRQSSACVCVCGGGGGGRMCKLRKLLVCLLCNVCIFNNCSLNFKI